MFEIESYDCEDVSFDQHQDGLAHGTLASDSPVRKTLARNDTVSIRGCERKDEGKSQKKALPR